MHQKMEWRPGVNDENTKGIKKAVVVKDGLIKIEMIGMVLSKNIPISFLIREEIAVQT